MLIYLKQDFKLSLIIIYFSNPSMYENNFWYLFDVKKLTASWASRPRIQEKSCASTSAFCARKLDWKGLLPPRRKVEVLGEH